MKDFFAIDFETATQDRHSACALGIVSVIDNEIVDRQHFIIQPPNNKYAAKNIEIHGIIPEFTINAPTIAELYQELKELFDGKILVCHNAEFDLDVLNKSLKSRNIDNDINYQWCCTKEIYHNKLEVLAEEYNLDLDHHNPLSDAEACAALFIMHNKAGVILHPPFKSNYKKISGYGAKTIQSSTLKQLDETAVTDNQNPFFNKKVVISGTFTEFPYRDVLAEKLQALGADINQSISKKTNIFVAGDNIGPVKMQKVSALIKEGYDIEMWGESMLLDLFDGNYEPIVKQKSSPNYTKREKEIIKSLKIVLVKDFYYGSNPFIDKNIFITGQFIQTSQNAGRKMIDSMKSHIVDSIDRAHYILYGANPDYEILAQVVSMQQNGYGILAIKESTFCSIVNNIEKAEKYSECYPNRYIIGGDNSKHGIVPPDDGYKFGLNISVDFDNEPTTDARDLISVNVVEAKPIQVDPIPEPTIVENETPTKDEYIEEKKTFWGKIIEKLSH